MTAPAASHPSETTDASLLERVAEGSAEALASLYDRHAGAVYSIAARTTGDATVASRRRSGDLPGTVGPGGTVRSDARVPAGMAVRDRPQSGDRSFRHASRHDRALAFSTLATADNDDGSLAEWLTTSGAPVAMAAPDPGPETTVVGRETRA